MSPQVKAHRKSDSVADLILSFVDMMPFAVAITSLDGKVRFINRAMNETLDQGTPFSIDKGRLQLADLELQRKFDQAMVTARIAASAGQPPKPAHFFAANGDATLSQSVFVTPIGVEPEFGFPDDTAVLVMARPWTAHDALDLGHLRDVFGLSEHEAKLIFALIETGSLARAAEVRGLTGGSARQYLKRVYQKTGTRGQVELISLCLKTLML